MFTSYLKKILYSEGVNPLPTLQIIILYFLMFLNAMTITMVYSFLPKMVKVFGASEVIHFLFIVLLYSCVVLRMIYTFFLYKQPVCKQPGLRFFENNNRIQWSIVMLNN